MKDQLHIHSLQTAVTSIFINLLCCVLIVVNKIVLAASWSGGRDGGWSGLISLLEVSV